MNGTPDGYNHEISSPGWGLGRPNRCRTGSWGSPSRNRLLVPPDGLTFKRTDRMETC